MGETDSELDLTGRTRVGHVGAAQPGSPKNDSPDAPRVPGYRILSKMSAGGMGVVFLAEHIHLQRLVALKVLRAELSLNAQFRARFLRESRVVAALDHPNVIPIFDAGEVGTTLFVAMRLVQGGDLSHILVNGRMIPDHACRILEQAATGLHAAHLAGLIHRDVKPANLLLERIGDEMRVFVSDFGIVKPVAETTMTASGAIMGTIQYIAPEQIRGEKLTPATDVYSLGCVGYELLAGYPPFVRRSEYDLLNAHLNDQLPDFPSDLNIDVSVQEAIRTATQKNPLERYQSMDAFAAAVS